MADLWSNLWQAPFRQRRWCHPSRLVLAAIVKIDLAIWTLLLFMSRVERRSATLLVMSSFLRRLLLVEDNRLLCATLANTRAEYDIEATCAFSSTEAKRQLTAVQTRCHFR